MEFLIFVFVIVSILSSLNDWAKKKREKKREKFFDPWSFERDSQIERLKKIGKKEDSFKKTSDKTKTSLSKDEIGDGVLEKKSISWIILFTLKREKNLSPHLLQVNRRQRKRLFSQSYLRKMRKRIYYHLPCQIHLI